MKSRSIEFHTDPAIAFDEYLYFVWPFIERSSQFLVPAGLYFAGGMSEADALSRPKLLLTCEDFLADSKDWSTSFQSELVASQSYWVPDPSGFSFLLRRTKKPARLMAFFALQFQGDALLSQRVAELQDACLQEKDRYRFAVVTDFWGQMEQRWYWRDGVFVSTATGTAKDLGAEYAGYVKGI
jgi:hypothetical protein